MKTYKQCTLLEAIAGAVLNMPGAKGRKPTIKIGDKFWVTNPEHDQRATGSIMIQRNGRGHINTGWRLWPADMKAIFKEAE